MNGSGTTMLLDCLNNHPNIYGFRRETLIFPKYLNEIDRYGNLNNTNNFKMLFQNITNENAFRSVNDLKPIPFPDEWLEFPRELSSVINYVFTYFSVKEQKSRWAEKTPINGLYMQEILKHFPLAKFIHIIRDGRDCAASLNRRYGYSPNLMITKWKHVVKETRKKGRIAGKQYYEVFYEDVSTMPEKSMRDICKFLEEPYAPELLKTSRFRKNINSTGTCKIIPNSNKWQKYFTSKKALNLEKIAGKELQQLGYKTTLSNGDKTPCKLYIRFWMYYGYALSRMTAMVRHRKQLRREIAFSIDKYKSRARLNKTF